VTHEIDQGFPTWGTCTPGGTFKVNNRKENMFIYYLFSNIYTYISENNFQRSIYARC